tara:strand:+ start:361 stop:1503 length:1143 start_codon:yes stop_codon:yes gene_type:complete
MELQKYINENDDYLSQFKEHKLFVRKYSNEDLCIVKGYYNRKYDYENNPWLRYCRGVVINTKTNHIVCIPPQKAESYMINNQSENVVYKTLDKKLGDLQQVIDTYDENDLYEPLFDGTMINVFYHNDKWMFSTRSNIGARNSWDGKVSFLKMFLEVNGEEWINQLKKNYCYSFVLHHVNNRNISPIEKNQIFLVDNHKIENGVIEKTQLEEIENISNSFNLTKEMLYGYYQDLFFSIKGFTIKNKHKRTNWINPNFEYVKSLKMNHNDKYLNYISLKQKRLLQNYLIYFPEDRFVFDEYKEEFNKIKMLLYSRYVSRFIKKEIETKDIEYPLKPLVYELHGYYKKNKEKINMKIISDYMHNLDGKKMMFIRNYLKYDNSN